MPNTLRLPPLAFALLCCCYLFAACSASKTNDAWREFSGETALDHVTTLVGFGPRPSGSVAIESSRSHITSHLQQYGWSVTRQTFHAPTPHGPITFVNLIATHNPVTSGRIILASHYDTKVFNDVTFVGANDAGSSTAVLLEIARVLASSPDLASRCELVFFDGEECFIDYTATDGLFGSRHYATELKSSGKAADYQCGILLDMVGDKHLRLTLPADSPRGLAKVVFASADALEIRRHVSLSSNSILDDHVPLNEAGIPTINLIDFDYPPWHTADDTLDKLSAQSLETVGRLTLHAVVSLTAFRN